jgi:hypothetical protein
MVETDLFAEAKYLGPSHSSDPDLVIDVISDGPTFATVRATPIETHVHSVTKTYTIPPPPDSQEMTKRRKRNAVRAGVIGGAVGMLICGPVGAVLVGVGCATVSKRVSRKKERRIWMAYDLKVAQQAAVAVSMEIHTTGIRNRNKTTAINAT